MSIKCELEPISSIYIYIHSKSKVEDSFLSSSWMPVHDCQGKWFWSGNEIIVLGLSNATSILSEIIEFLSILSGDKSILHCWVRVGSLSGCILPDVLGADLKGMVNKVVSGHDKLVLRIGGDCVNRRLYPLDSVTGILLDEETIVAIGWKWILNSDGISIEHVVVSES